MVRARALARIAVDSIVLAMVSILYGAFPWVTITAHRWTQGESENVMKWVNGSIWSTLIVIALITLFDAFREIGRLVRSRSGNAAPVLTVS
jgi:hypothetical protein